MLGWFLLEPASCGAAASMQTVELISSVICAAKALIRHTGLVIREYNRSQITQSLTVHNSPSPE